MILMAREELGNVKGSPLLTASEVARHNVCGIRNTFDDYAGFEVFGKFWVRAILLVDFDPNSIVTGESGIRNLSMIVPLCDALMLILYIVSQCLMCHSLGMPELTGIMCKVGIVQSRGGVVVLHPERQFSIKPECCVEGGHTC